MSDYESDIVVVGARHHPLRDAYHSLLSMRWAALVAVVVGTFLVLNLAFAEAYLLTDGIAGARPGSLRDAFFFSVQTMGTIGYGAMYPKTDAANALVVAEAVVGLILTALATGIVFARFTRTTGMVMFSTNPCISPMNGVPTLSFRVGNDRSSAIYEAQVRCVAFKTEKTSEGVTFYRVLDLALVRDRTPTLERSWSIMHVIDEKSPLFGATPSSCELDEVEIGVSIVGVDDTSLQPVHGRHRYVASDIRWGARPADILSERPDGKLALDVRKFHDVVPTPATEAFPYSLKA